MTAADAADGAECVVLRWESEAQRRLGSALSSFIRGQVQGQIADVVGGLVLGAAYGTLAWPLALIQASDVLDGPWAIAQQRADKAGVRLAEALLARAQVWTRHTHTQTRRDNKIYSCPVSLRCHVLQQGGCAWRMRC
mmetsp:Transcript_29469/g.77509  ORF Transcript_29469/g.77509 Transcript_29469/m.77509 type:complete len:137 (-) Transcript_29469:997-1407(-)